MPSLNIDIARSWAALAAATAATRRSARRPVAIILVWALGSFRTKPVLRGVKIGSLSQATVEGALTGHPTEHPTGTRALCTLHLPRRQGP